MSSDFSWEKLRRDGIAGFLNNPERRKTAALKLASTVARHIPALSEEKGRELAAQALSEWWPEVLSRSQGVRELYWPELIAALAVTLTLLHGACPESVDQFLQSDAELRTRYQEALQPHERYVLLVAEHGELARLFLGPAASPPPLRPENELEVPANLEQEPAFTWSLCPSLPFSGRSHTGMLALCALERAGALRLPKDRPFAATAELDQDGRTLKGVEQLREKMRKWQRQFPDGVLLTAPPPETTEEGWAQLFEEEASDGDLAGLMAQPTSVRRWAPRLNAAPPSAAQWLCAGSLEEAAAKLDALLGSQKPSGLIEPLRAWDGSEIPAAATLSVSIHDDYKTDQKLTRLFQQELLFNICWSLRHGTARRPLFWATPSRDDNEVPDSALSRLLQQANTAAREKDRAAIMHDAEELLASDSRPSRRRVARSLSKGPPSEERTIAARGAIFYGGPGSGKSIWSLCVAASFVTGVMGALGMAIRVGARRLAQAIAGAPAEATLLDHLSSLHPEQGALLRRLHDQRRLFIIIDGLDEISAAALSQVGRLLAGFAGPFLATTRDTHHPLDAFPPYLRYRIQPLAEDHVSQFLRAMHRRDLLEQLCKEPTHGSVSFRELSPPVRALCETPLNLALLCHVVARGEKLAAVRHSDLYERSFQARLVRATTERRLSDNQVELVRRTVSKVLGELALAWLLSQRGYITDEAIIACLEHNQITGADAIRYQQALEHGNLIVPGDGRREFAHKTLAEWSAAKALELDIQRQLARVSSEHRHIDYAQLEIDAIDARIGAASPLHGSLLRQTILFFASWSRAPLALVKRALRTASDGGDARSSADIQAHFVYARELALQARWQNTQDVHTVWSLLVRRELFPHTDEPDDEAGSRTRRHHREHGAVPELHQLTEQLAAQLPSDKAGLIDLVAHNAQQRAALEADLTLLLPFCVRHQAPAFAELLTSDLPRQVEAVLSCYERWQVEVKTHVLNRLCETALEDHDRVAAKWERVQRHEYVVEPPIPELKSGVPFRLSYSRDNLWFSSQDHLREVEACEAQIYSICVTQAHLPPRSVLHRRLLDWPKHLTEALTRLLALIVETATDAELRDQVLALLDEQAAIADAAAEMLAQLARHPRRDALAETIHSQVDCEEEVSRHGMGRWSRFREQAAAIGWQLERKPYNSDRTQNTDEETQLWRQMLSAIDAVLDAENCVRAICKLLLEAADSEERAKALWSELPDEGPHKTSLMQAFRAAGRIPACIDIQFLIAALEPSNFATHSTFAPVHAEVLASLAERGTGKARFCGLRWQLRDKHRDALSDWEPLLSAADPELVSLVRNHLKGFYLSTEDRARLFPEEMNSAELLKAAVQGRHAGWEDRLLSALQSAFEIFGNEAEGIYGLIENSKLIAAALELRRRVLVAPPADNAYSNLLSALFAVDPNPGDDVIDALLRWPFSRLPPSLIPQIQERHVPTLLQQQLASVDNSALHTRLKQLRGDHLAAVRTRLTELYAERKRTAEQLRILKEESERELRRESPGTTEVSSEQPRDRYAIEFKLNAEDREVEQTIQFWERVAFSWHCLRYPTLAELCAYLEREPCRNLKGYVAEVLQLRLRDGEGTVPALHQLLRHPEEFLRELAYKELLERTPHREQLNVVIDALEAQLSLVDEIPVSKKPPYLRGRVRFGTEHEDLYGHTAELLKHLRERLTAVHRKAIERLTRSPYALVRSRTAAWLAELGSHSFLPLVKKLISDGDSAVAAAALRTFEQLTVFSERATILSCDRSRWTSVHHAQLLCWLVRERRPIAYSQTEFRHYKRSSAVIASTEVLAVLLREAIASLAKERSLRRKDDVAGFETAVARWEELAADLDQRTAQSPTRWITDEVLFDIAVDACEPVRAAIFRRLIARGSPQATAAIDALLKSADPRERVLGAECSLLSGNNAHKQLVIEIWQSAFAVPASEPLRVSWEQSQEQLASFSGHDRIRLARALLVAAPEYIDLTALVAGEIYEYYENDSDDSGSDLYVNDPEALRILCILMERHGLPVAQAVLRRLISPTECAQSSGRASETWGWAASIFRSRPDLLPGILDELSQHRKSADELRQLFEELSEPSAAETAAAERQHLRTALLPADWNDNDEAE